MSCIRRDNSVTCRRAACIVGTLIVVAAVCSCSRGAKTARGEHLETGKKFLQQKDYARAVIELKNAIQVSPENPEAYYQLGLADLALGDVRSAGALFHKATELNPKHVEAQKALARLMATSRSPEILSEAVKRLQTVLTLNPADVESFNTLASTEYKLGNTSEAEASLRRALEKNPHHVQSLTGLASLRMAAKDPEGAGRLLKQATEAAPNSPEAWIGLGRYYLASGKTAEAGARFQKAVEVKPNDPNALFELGKFQIAAKLPDKAEQTFRRMADLPERQFRPLYGRYLFSNGRKDEAIFEFQRLTAADPGDREYRSFLVAAYFSAGRKADAESVLDEALKKNPKDSDARLQRAELYLQTGRLTSARSDLEDTIRRRPDDAMPHYLLARVCQLQGDTALQRQELNRALQYNPSILAARIQLAASLNSSGSHAAALTLLDQAPAEQKRTLPLLVERNWALIGSGDFTRARQSVNEGLAQGRTAELLTQQALLDLRESKTGKARNTLEEVLKLDPGSLRAVQYLASTYFMTKQENAAVAAVRTYLSGQQSPEAQLYLSEVLLRAGDRSGARTAVMAAKRLNPGLPASDLMLAQIEIAEGKRDSARLILTWLLNSNRSVEDAAMLLGGIEQSTGNYRTAADYFHKVLDINIGNWIAANNYAACLSALGRHDEALKFAQQAKELRPTTPSVVDTLGWILYNKGLFKLASREYDALAGSPSAVHQYHRAMAYMKAGNLTGGRMALEQAKKIDPAAAEAQMATTVYQQVSQTQR